MGVAALGWGLYALRGASAVAPGELGVAGLPPQGAAMTEPAATTATAAPAAAGATTAAVATAANPTPLPIPTVAPAPPPAVLARSADPVALRVSAGAPGESAAAPGPPRSETSFGGERPAAAPTLSASPSRRPPSERARGVPAKQRGSPLKNVADQRGNTCSGLWAGALCVLNPCKNPGTRSSAQCLDRQRAEEVRLRRMERE
jgi:hypothetical protein